MKRDKTSLIAMLAAAVILGSVGIKSYFDYRAAVETKANDQNSAPAPAAETTPAVPAPDAGKVAATPAPAPAEGASEAESINQLPRSVLPPIPEQILNAKAPETSPTAAPPATPGGAPSANPGQSQQMRAEIDALR
ncbi:MAG: hypothetical protein KDL87_17160, partial [Verrucomicrobiae bacterium]|nr:hypothetical protein [Verrucomicrobiae bacterium]